MGRCETARARQGAAGMQMQMRMRMRILHFDDHFLLTVTTTVSVQIVPGWCILHLSPGLARLVCPRLVVYMGRPETLASQCQLCFNHQKVPLPSTRAYTPHFEPGTTMVCKRLYQPGIVTLRLTRGDASRGGGGGETLDGGPRSWGCTPSTRRGDGNKEPYAAASKTSSF
jgi:hypothetical protein